MEMKAPCEIVIWYLLPSLRVALTRELVNLGMSQRAVAECLRITDAAVSQYVKGKRGKAIALGEELDEEIRKLAKRIDEGVIEEANVVREMCKLCQMAKEMRFICQIHTEIEGLPEDCDLCM